MTWSGLANLSMALWITFTILFLVAGVTEFRTMALHALWGYSSVVAFGLNGRL